MLNIGPRIKYFRKRLGLSQMKLELMTDCAFGSISRFESGKINPNKSTLEYICQALELNELEINYLIGANAYPVSAKEITLAKGQVNEIFAKKGFLGYLIDDRWRLHAYSESLVKLFGFNKEDEENLSPILFKSTFIEILLRPELKISKYLWNDASNHNLKMSLKHYYKEVSFMVDDIYLKNSLESIEQNELAKAIWAQIKKESESLGVPTTEDRKNYFQIAGTKICLNFNVQYLNDYPRFKLVELIPNNQIIQILTKIV